MSGGSLNYFYHSLEEHADDFGDKELKELCQDLAELFHDREWFLSGDTCEGEWNEKRDDFKHKWFGKGNRPERIERYLAEYAREIRLSIGIERDYCQNCKFWKTSSPGKYGKCEHKTGCMMHRREWCEKYEEA